MARRNDQHRLVQYTDSLWVV